MVLNMTVKILKLYVNRSEELRSKYTLNYMIYWMKSGSFCYLDKLTGYFDEDGKPQINRYQLQPSNTYKYYLNLMKVLDAKEIGEIRGNLTFKKFKDTFPEHYL